MSAFLKSVLGIAVLTVAMLAAMGQSNEAQARYWGYGYRGAYYGPRVVAPYRAYRPYYAPSYYAPYYAAPYYGGYYARPYAVGYRGGYIAAGPVVIGW